MQYRPLRAVQAIFGVVSYAPQTLFRINQLAVGDTARDIDGYFHLWSNRLIAFAFASSAISMYGFIDW